MVTWKEWGHTVRFIAPGVKTGYYGATKNTTFWETAEVKLRIFWDVLPCSKLNVGIQLRTQQCIPEGSELHTRRRENLESHTAEVKFGPRVK
jgi:hypothetical protein